MRRGARSPSGWHTKSGNPLTPIQLSAERLQMKLSSKLSGSDAEMLTRATDTIVKQVAALKGMVDAFPRLRPRPDNSPCSA